jgi:flagellar FliL protein
MAGEKHEAAAAAPAAPAGGGKLVPILTIVNLLATLGIVGMMVMSFQKTKSHQGVEDIDGGHDAAGEHGDGGHGAAAGGHGEDAGHGAPAADHGGGDGHGGGGHGEAAKKSSVNYGTMVALDQFMVNLSTPGSAAAKYVRVNISLEVPNADVQGEATAKMPQIRNAIIDLFNAKTARELSTADGREYLKEEIRNAINGFMVQGKVKGVFFTYFSLGG